MRKNRNRTVTIALPSLYISAIDILKENGLIESRSYFVREAIKKKIKKQTKTDSFFGGIIIENNNN